MPNPDKMVEYAVNSKIIIDSSKLLQTVYFNEL